MSQVEALVKLAASVPAVVAAVLLLGRSSDARANETPRLAVTALARVDPEPAIEFTVLLEGAGQVRVYEAELPWGNLYSVRVVLRTPSGRQVCKRRPRVIADPGPDTRLLVRGEPVTGRYLLLRVCPELNAALLKSDVNAEWTYVVWREPFTKESHSGQVTLRRAPGRRTMR